MMNVKNYLSFRQWSCLFVFSILLATNFAFAKELVNDVTQINPIYVDKVITPKTISEVQAAVKNHSGKISIGGGRFSMGGQIATESSLHLDMRKLNNVIDLDVKNKKITVQAGITWRDIQNKIDPEDLSIKIMQSYSNFTVGGSLSVNAHGRYRNEGPLIGSVDSIKIVLANGELVTASKENNIDIFYGAIGGYGGLGVIVEATLNLVDNIKLERNVVKIPSSKYVTHFKKNLRDNPEVVLHNGDIYPPEYKSVNVISWLKTDKDLTIKDRLMPKQESYLEPKVISVMTSLPKSERLRSFIDEKFIYDKDAVVWRNYEASYDVASLEPKSRKKTTYVLQEYFVPINKFDSFIPKMRAVFKRNKANIFNVSIRHATKDPGSLLAWAKEECFAFVVYYRQGVTPKDKQHVANWTREMINEVLSVGGTYYLPYQIHATDFQFQSAYPRHEEFFALKQKLDPDYKFRNKLWDRYYNSLPFEISEKVSSLKDYKRPEDQTYWTLPEWYVVFSSSEYAHFLKENKPSKFSYWKSIKEFWKTRSKIKTITSSRYPKNSSYNTMIWFVGISYSAEFFIKGLYENIIGKITEFLTSKNGTDEDRLIQKYHQEYAEFIHTVPWYEFKFLDKIHSLWTETSFFGQNFIRKLERKMFFTAEFLFKALYASFTSWMTKTSYEPQALKIYAVLKDPKNQLLNFTDIQTVHKQNDIVLASIPRYQKFNEIVEGLSSSDIILKEIAGNRIIFLTAIADIKIKPEFSEAFVEGKSKLPSNKTKQRLMLTTQVEFLLETLTQLQKQNIELEHIYDY